MQEINNENDNFFFDRTMIEDITESRKEVSRMMTMALNDDLVAVVQLKIFKHEMLSLHC